MSTAEPWHIWLLQPELVEQVDFITLHLLPYWEGVALEVAVDDALARYEQVRRRFPGKPIVIGEVGWPSAGNPVKQAHASPAAQAVFVRQFVARAEAMKLDYFLMEAVDQPWKQATEGTVGAHWGLLDAQRQPKFAFDGTVLADPYWQAKAAAATVLGLLAMLPFLWRFAHMRLAGRVAFALMAQAAASFAVLLFTRPFEHYLRLTDALMLAVLLPALILMAAMLLAQCFEFAELFWRGSLRRQVTTAPLPAGPASVEPGAPLISIHLACSNEPPDTVIQAIDSLIALQWPRLEILVVDNNTQDPKRWQPLQAHVEALWSRGLAHKAPADGGTDALPGPTLRFFHLPQWPGFKAGALNFALRHTDAEAKWVAVVDADYVVGPHWLTQVAAWLQAQDVGIVQAPQAHRQWQGRRLARMMNWEYEGFFRIGMHHRHERNAIIQHGTMTLIRRAALDTLGGWDEACICEDTELGLRVLEAGWAAVYVDEVMGAGLVPVDFGAYRRQRQRWAQGGMQILRRHWRALLLPAPGRRAAAAVDAPPGSRRGLGLGQRYHFLAGWLPWLGDALHLLFSVLLLLWSLGFLLAPQFFGLPLWLFVVPLAVFFAARALLGPLLYRRRVACSGADAAGAAVAGMGLSHSVAQGVLAGLTAQPAQFHVTRRVGHPGELPSRRAALVGGQGGVGAAGRAVGLRRRAAEPVRAGRPGAAGLDRAAGRAVAALRSGHLLCLVVGSPAAEIGSVRCRSSCRRCRHAAAAAGRADLRPRRLQSA